VIPPCFSWRQLTSPSLIAYDFFDMAQPALTRITGNYQVTVPKDAREQLGLKRGDILEARVERGAVVFRPKVVVVRDRDEFLRELREDVKQSKADVAAGRVLGTFGTARDFAKALTAYKKRAKHARGRA
jgi:AbrB family looped-hinge helix DNA binding protein